MTEADFRSQRRQQFLTLKYFLLNKRELEGAFSQNQKGIEKSAEEPIPDADSESQIFKDWLKLLRLNYTAGEPIESLQPLFRNAMVAFEEWHRKYSIYLQKISDSIGKPLKTAASPLEFGDLFSFGLAMDLVSLGVLLGEGSSVRQAASLMASSRGSDMMFEAVIRPAVTDFRDVEEFFHEEPYGLLVDAIYTADTPQEASDFVKRYLDNWYKAFEGVPWHNGHLVVNDEYSNYQGYWAFDAAAVCVIHGIDDSSFRDHIVYPRDLADWARAHDVMRHIGPNAGDLSGSGLRCEGGQPCPRTGYWHTPALEGGRQRFDAGAVMPKYDSDYGATIWQWDSNQAG